MICMSAGIERPASAEGGVIMMNLINTAYTANLSVILAEDTGTPELRNPKLSGMSRNRKSMFTHFFKRLTARK